MPLPQTCEVCAQFYVHHEGDESGCPHCAAPERLLVREDDPRYLLFVSLIHRRPKEDRHLEAISASERECAVLQHGDWAVYEGHRWQIAAQQFPMAGAGKIWIRKYSPHGIVGRRRKKFIDLDRLPHYIPGHVLQCIEREDALNFLIFPLSLSRRVDGVRQELVAVVDMEGSGERAMRVFGNRPLDFDLAFWRAPRHVVEWAIRRAYDSHQASIQGCRAEMWEYQCPLQWSKLRDTDDPKVRFCDVCSQRVQLCSTEDERVFHRERGDCIAVGAGDSLSGGMVTMGIVARVPWD